MDQERSQNASKVVGHPVILMNCAIWHQQKSETASTPEARARHAKISDRLFIRAYHASRA